MKKDDGVLIATNTRYGLARILSKRGVCSRTEAATHIRAGRVKVAGQRVTDPEAPTALDAKIEFDDTLASAALPIYLMLNKPRGQVVTAKDEKGRATIFDCFDVLPASHIAPVGRLDQASEGLLLLTNDTAWAGLLMAPDAKVEKLYHVQVDGLVSDAHIVQLRGGILDAGEFLRVARVDLLRAGQKNCWLEITLNEGKNRHIRRMLAVLGFEVLRLIRVRIGALELGPLAKGAWRELLPAERTLAAQLPRASGET
jgi:23S rRNA pseudouridine2605 synthase